jgi:hypothetical protein
MKKLALCSNAEITKSKFRPHFAWQIRESGRKPKLPPLNVTFRLVVKAFFEHPPRKKRCLRAIMCPNQYTFCFISHHRLVFF